MKYQCIITLRHSTVHDICTIPLKYGGNDNRAPSLMDMTTVQIIMRDTIQFPNIKLWGSLLKYNLIKSGIQ